MNRGEKGEKPDNPNKPVKPDKPGREDSADKRANKTGKGTHKYGYDKLNRMTSSNIAGTTTTYTYDMLGNMVLEKTKNKVVDYQYNELNQLTKKKEVEYNSWDPALMQENLKELKDWYDSCNETVHKISYINSGWMINPDGSISLNTIFAGFTREV